jgi:competence protein ComEA
VSAPQSNCWVEAENKSGLCHIYDVSTSSGVAEMTLWMDATPLQARLLRSHDYVPGEHVEIVEENSGMARVAFSWMRAGKRMALGILLYPDRMTGADWQDLPGIGPGLARKINQDRQINGGYGSIHKVKRVHGIGDKSIENIRVWFAQPTKPGE